MQKRLEKVLPHIIHYDQNAFVKGRTIFDATRTIGDVMDFTSARDHKGIMTAIDFEKAFDSINWNFLSKSLESLVLESLSGHGLKCATTTYRVL